MTKSKKGKRQLWRLFKRNHKYGSGQSVFSNDSKEGPVPLIESGSPQLDDEEPFALNPEDAPLEKSRSSKDRKSKARWFKLKALNHKNDHNDTTLLTAASDGSTGDNLEEPVPPKTDDELFPELHDPSPSLAMEDPAPLGRHPSTASASRTADVSDLEYTSEPELEEEEILELWKEFTEDMVHFTEGGQPNFVASRSSEAAFLQVNFADFDYPPPPPPPPPPLSARKYRSPEAAHLEPPPPPPPHLPPLPVQRRRSTSTEDAHFQSPEISATTSDLSAPEEILSGTWEAAFEDRDFDAFLNVLKDGRPGSTAPVTLEEATAVEDEENFAALQVTDSNHSEASVGSNHFVCETTEVTDAPRHHSSMPQAWLEPLALVSGPSDASQSQERRAKEHEGNDTMKLSVEMPVLSPSESSHEDASSNETEFPIEAFQNTRDIEAVLDMLMARSHISSVGSEEVSLVGEASAVCPSGNLAIESKSLPSVVHTEVSPPIRATSQHESADITHHDVASMNSQEEAQPGGSVYSTADEEATSEVKGTGRLQAELVESPTKNASRLGDKVHRVSKGVTKNIAGGRPWMPSNNSRKVPGLTQGLAIPSSVGTKCVKFTDEIRYKQDILDWYEAAKEKEASRNTTVMRPPTDASAFPYDEAARSGSSYLQCATTTKGQLLSTLFGPLWEQVEPQAKGPNPNGTTDEQHDWPSHCQSGNDEDEHSVATSREGGRPMPFSCGESIDGTDTELGASYFPDEIRTQTESLDGADTELGDCTRSCPSDPGRSCTSHSEAFEENSNANEVNSTGTPGSADSDEQKKAVSSRTGTPVRSNYRKVCATSKIIREGDAELDDENGDEALRQILSKAGLKTYDSAPRGSEVATEAETKQGAEDYVDTLEPCDSTTYTEEVSDIGTAFFSEVYSVAETNTEMSFDPMPKSGSTQKPSKGPEKRASRNVNGRDLPREKKRVHSSFMETFNAAIMGELDCAFFSGIGEPYDDFDAEDSDDGIEYEEGASTISYYGEESLLSGETGMYEERRAVDDDVEKAVEKAVDKAMEWADQKLYACR